MDKRQRKRGIKGSRVKLEIAMAACGLKTQMALAEKIARNESIDKPPKDLVNKVFNEKPVSITNLARIAKALDVEIHTIYLSASDDQINDILVAKATDETDDECKDDGFKGNELDNIFNNRSFNFNKKKRFSGPFMLILLSCVMLFMMWLVLLLNDDVHMSLEKEQPNRANTKITSPLGKILIIIQSPKSTQKLATDLASTFNLESKLSVMLSKIPESYSVSSNDALAKFQAHGILQFYVQESDDYNWIKVTLTSKQHSATLANLFVRKNELKVNSLFLASLVKEQIIRFVSGEELEFSHLYSHSDDSLSYYFRGINAQFISHTLSSNKAAKNLLLKAIELDQNFVQAYAKLCLIQVRISWIENEVAALEQAANYCQKAESIAPNDVHTIIAKAQLFARTGDIIKAVEYATPLSKLSLSNADAAVTLAELYLSLSDVSPEQSYDDYIVEYAKKAIDIDQRYWRAYNTLGRFYFNKGNVELAKSNFLNSTKIVNQEVILANVGTMQMCSDELAEAKKTYHKLIESFEGGSLGYEQLGTIHFILQDYEQAIAYKLKAIEIMPNIAIHQVWSSLAEAYLLTGNTEKAIEYYTKSLSIIERDELMGNSTLGDKSDKLYYEVKLNGLAPKKFVVDNYELTVKAYASKRSNMKLSSRSHLAWLIGKLGHSEVQQELVDEIVAICPVYRRFVELYQYD